MRWLAAVCFILGVLAVASPAQGDHAHFGEADAYHLIRSRATADVYVLEGGVEGWRQAGYTPGTLMDIVSVA